MKKRKSRKPVNVRDLKFLKAARLRANTQAAVERIDAEIAAYSAEIPSHKLNHQALAFAKLAKDLNEYLKLCLKNPEDR